LLSLPTWTPASRAQALCWWVETAPDGTRQSALPIGGGTLVERVAHAVSAAAGSVTLVGAPERYAGLGFRVLADTRPGAGPLAGIHTALCASPAAWNLIVACDMPGISASFLSSLLAAAEGSAADCLLPAGPSGLPEPLCAVYHGRCADTIAAALDRQVRKVTDGLAGLRVATWNVAESGWFRNVNTPEDWAQYTHE
jgi:Molybdopterin-guanine dinucleotide biosynthesis protein A